jgi:starch phosphorylase
MGALLDPYALTIAFTRRFTQYKRPYLILSDIERLKRIVTDPLRPIQIIFGGKSHPADHASKELLKSVYNVALDKRFQGRIVFKTTLNLFRLVRGWTLVDTATGGAGSTANGKPRCSVINLV